MNQSSTDSTNEIVESATACPSCNYSGDSEFLTCPSCGLIIKKYQMLKALRADTSTSGEIVADGAVERPKSRKGLLIFCSLVIAVLGVFFYRAGTHQTLPGSHVDNPPGPSASAPDHIVNPAPSTNVQAEKEPAGATTSPNTLSNSIGIKIKNVIFASDVDASNMPVDNLSRVPFSGKKIVVRVKMEIPPEKTYQFAGKFYDADGKLVMNVASPTSPSLSVWYAWYYHNFDRNDDKPGLWKFVFLVNGEQVLEAPIEVVAQ